jgi:diguanylate cyclase (GGDEF)-like protein/PAS domain S-box-containing protein
MQHIIDALTEHLDSAQAQIAQFKQDLRSSSNASSIEACQTALRHLEQTVEELQTTLNEILVQQDTLIEAQQLLAAERTRYQGIFQHNPEAQLLTNVFGVVHEVNRAAAQLFRLPKDYLIHKPIAPYFSFANRQRFRFHLNQLRRGQMADRWEDSLQFAQGDSLPVQITAVVADYNHRKVLHWSIRDISAQKKAEDVLKNANEALEQRVHERLKALVEINAQLNQEIDSRQRAETALQQRIKQEQLMQSITSKIRRSLDLDAILGTTVDEVRQFFRADRVLVYRFMANLSGVVTAESVGRGWPKILYSEIEDPCFRESCAHRYRQGSVRAIADVEKEITNECLLKLLHRLQVQACLTVPILQGQTLWGLILVQQCRAPRQWQSSDTELLQNLSAQLAIAIQQSELYEQVQRLAITDALTQVANRYRLESYLEETWQRLSREAAPLSFVLCDIDFFKEYNDTYGHPVGDTCLHQVAQILTQAAKRPADLVARYGGEEFAIVLPNTDLNGAKHIVKTIQGAIADAQIEHTAVHQGRLTLSYGVVAVMPTPDKSISHLVGAADGQLYRAKIAGRNQWAALDFDA